MSLMSFLQQQPSSSTSTTSGTGTDTTGEFVPGPEGSQLHVPATGPGPESAITGEGFPGPRPETNMTGETAYPYRVYDKPYSGTPSNLVTRQGLTLQRGPMRSLVDIARAVNILPGIQEIGKIGGGYREFQGTGPTFAPEDMSYHEQGLAIDAGWWSEIEKLNRMLGGAGWNQFDRSWEPWHYSYGVTG